MDETQTQIQQILIKVTGIENKLDNVIESSKVHGCNIDELYNERNRMTSDIIKMQMQIKIVSFIGTAVAIGLIGGLVGAFLKIILKS